MLSSYKLRAQLIGHSADVRSVAVSPSGIIATASRDKTAITWNLETCEPQQTLTGHTHFVTDVKFLNDATLVTSSNDKTIRVWEVESGETTAVLKGHEAPVCAIACASSCNDPSLSQYIVSCSWDNTARVWDLASGLCLHDLRGHTAAVWNARFLPDGRVVTVAADKHIRIWDLNSPTPTSISLPFQHTDVIRDVCAVLPHSITTVSNDSSIVHWCESSQSFKVSARLSEVHDGSYIYSVDAKKLSEQKWQFITGGEDNALRVTGFHESSNELTINQTIVHPGTVWGVTSGPGDDIVTACSDGIARVFTCHPDKVANDDIIRLFEKTVSERQVNSKVIGGVDVGKLPDLGSALSTPGKKDGENKIVKTKDGKAEVYMWSASDERWTKVGDVVDDPDGGAPQSSGAVHGKNYDFVFDVELSEGGRKEKLGFNRGENPYTAAQRFIDDNELDQEFLDQIAQFIEQHVPPDAIAAVGGSLSDPLTGGSRYVPSGGSRGSSSNTGDPLTGGSRYVPKNSESGSDLLEAKGALPPARKLLPYTGGLVSYKNSDQLDKIETKLVEVNREFSKDESVLALTAEEEKTFSSSLLPKLKESRESETIWEDAECAVVEKMIKWPTTKVFAALDVARLVAHSASGGGYFFGRQNGEILSDILGHLRSPDANGAVLIMSCRFLCNSFGNRVAGSAMRTRLPDVLQAAAVAAQSENRRARETFASLLINYAVMLCEGNGSLDERATIVKFAVDIVIRGERDEGTLYRIMLAAGSVMCGNTQVPQKAIELGIAKAAADVAPISGRLQQIAMEIATLIAS